MIKISVMWRYGAAGLLTLALTGTVASAGEATIIIGRSIAGVRLGDTQARVRKRLGRPRSTRDGWAYAEPLRGRVTFNKQERVIDIWTHSYRQKTRKGVGRGSSLRKVRLAYKPRCKKQRGNSWSWVCSKRTGRRAVTTFYFISRRLSVIEVSTTP